MANEKRFRTEFAYSGFYRVYEYSRLLGCIHKKKGLWVADISDLDNDVILGKEKTIQDALELFVKHFDGERG